MVAPCVANVLRPNGSRLSCGALKKDSFQNLRAASFKRLSGARPWRRLLAPRPKGKRKDEKQGGRGKGAGIGRFATHHR